MAKRSTSRVQEGTARSRIGGSEPLQREKLGKGSYLPSNGFVPNLTYTAIFMHSKKSLFAANGPFSHGRSHIYTHRVDYPARYGSI